jgi:fructokinase
MLADHVPRIVSIGELLWDILPNGPRLGGAPANFAVFCARLGDQTELITSIGDDEYGSTANRLLAQPNLHLHNVQVSPTHPTGTVAVALSSENQPTYTISTGVAWDYIQLTEKVRESAPLADAVCFGTLSQRSEVSRSTIRSFVESTNSNCVRVCDVNIRMPYCEPEVLAWSMLHATVIKTSDEELPVVFSQLGKPTMSITPQAAAISLLESFPQCQLVAVTLGAHGSLLATRKEIFTHPGFPIKLVDPVGAGDAFTAGLVHAYLHGVALAGMGEVGNLCGSFVASQSGATPALPPELIEKVTRLVRAAKPRLADKPS